MLDACLGKGLIDGELRGHHGVVRGGEDGLDAGSNEGLGSHLDLGGGGAVLFNVLDALFVAECLGVGNGLGGGILAQVVQQADGVDVRVDGQDQVHDGVRVQGIGGTGDVGLGVKAGCGRVGNGGVDHRDIGVFHSGQHGGCGGGGNGHDDIHAIGHEVGTDLVQVGLIGLCVGVVIGVIKGDTFLLGHFVQAALHRRNDLVQGSMIHVVDDAHFKGLACGGLAGSGRRCHTGSSSTGSSAACGRAAARQAQCGDNSGSGSCFQEAAARDPVHGFHSGTPFPGAGGPNDK